MQLLCRIVKVPQRLRRGLAGDPEWSLGVLSRESEIYTLKAHLQPVHSHQGALSR